MIVRRLLNFVQERVRIPENRARLNLAVAKFCPPPLPLIGDAAAHISVLQKNGNVVLPELMPLATLTALRAELSTMPCYDPWNPDLGDFEVSETPEITNNARIRGVADHPTARAIANHPLVLSIVSQYLQCCPTIDDIVAWWSLPGKPAPKEEQFFHRDNDAVRFLKLFVYMSDVGEDDGAHVFVQGSHLDSSLLEKRRRYQDREVLSSYNEAAVKKMTGVFGSAFLEDTYGLHKGAVPSKEPRLLLQVRYTSYPSTFARKTAILHSDHQYDPYINRFVA